MEAPKQGSYPTFLLGEPSSRADAQGNTWQYFDNLNETIVCLINDAADQGSAAPLKSKLRLFQFDPFIDTREVSLMQNVQHVYATPIRQGKAVNYYNVTENLIQFSKNRSESRFNEEEFGIFQNRNYSFQLSYDERLIDLRWFNLFAKSGDLNQQQFASNLSSIDS